MKIYKLIFIFLFLSNLIFSNTFAETPYFIDFSKVLNQSKAGKDAQDFLKKKFETEVEKFQKIESSLKEEERKIVSQKKLITKEEYQKKVQALRKKVSKLQSDKNKSLNDIAKLRAKAKTELLKNLNPIIKKYMEENKIRIVLDKKSVLLGDTGLEITSKIIEILNKQIKSLNLK